jgi:hypothetical protein
MLGAGTVIVPALPPLPVVAAVKSVSVPPPAGITGPGVGVVTTIGVPPPPPPQAASNEKRPRAASAVASGERIMSPRLCDACSEGSYTLTEP